MKWTVRWTNVSVNKLYFQDNAGSVNATTLGTTLRVIDQLSLPVQAGTLAYSFNYNPAAASPGWGELSFLRLPSGAEATYQYQYDGANSLVWVGVIDNVPTRKEFTFFRDYDGPSTPTMEPW